VPLGTRIKQKGLSAQEANRPIALYYHPWLIPS